MKTVALASDQDIKIYFAPKPPLQYNCLVLKEENADGQLIYLVLVACFGFFFFFLNIAPTILLGFQRNLAVQREAYIQFHGSLRCNPVRLQPLYFTKGNLSLENNRSHNTRSVAQSSCTKQLQDYRGPIHRLSPQQRCCDMTSVTHPSETQAPNVSDLSGVTKFMADKTLSSCLLTLTPLLLCISCSPERGQRQPACSFRQLAGWDKHTSLFLVQTLMSVKSRQLKPHFVLSTISGTVFCIFPISSV